MIPCAGHPADGRQFAKPVNQAGGGVQKENRSVASRVWAGIAGANRSPFQEIKRFNDRQALGGWGMLLFSPPSMRSPQTSGAEQAGKQGGYQGQD